MTPTRKNSGSGRSPSCTSLELQTCLFLKLSNECHTLQTSSRFSGSEFFSKCRQLRDRVWCPRNSKEVSRVCSTHFLGFPRRLCPHSGPTSRCPGWQTPWLWACHLGLSFLVCLKGLLYSLLEGKYLSMQIFSPHGRNIFTSLFSEKDGFLLSKKTHFPVISVSSNEGVLSPISAVFAVKVSKTSVAWAN